MRKDMSLRILLPAILLVMASGCVSKAIYHPLGSVLHTPKDASLSFEDVTFSTRDGVKISGWWIPAANPRGTVLFCHGNGGNISSCLDSAIIINSLGLNLLVFDYRGYGTSTGSPSEQGTYEDADAAWTYLTSERKIPPGRIIIWGRSLGGPIAARTASMHSAGLVIMESTFSSLQQLVNDRFFRTPSWVLSNYAYDTRKYLGKVGAPVLVIHSPDDEVVPFAHGKALYQSLTGPGSFLQIKGGHNNGFVLSRDVYQSSISTFINTYLPVKEADVP
jgi:uncharacterized protein